MALNEIDEIPAENDGLPPAVIWMAVVAFLMLFGFVLFIVFSADPVDPRQEKLAALELEKVPSGADDHRVLRFAFDEPVSEMPGMKPSAAFPADPEAPVIGVVAGDVAHAYVTHKSDRKDVFAISTLIGDKSIVIAHNYLDDTTRVLTDPSTKRVIPIRLGGLEETRQLVLLYKGVRYSQQSQQLPLEDYPFETTTLGEWLTKYPDSLVNFDEKIAASDGQRQDAEYLRELEQKAAGMSQ